MRNDVGEVKEMRSTGWFDTPSISTGRNVWRHCELVGTCEPPRRKLIVFLPAGAGSSARLPIEETTFGGLQQQTIRIVALRSDVGVKALVAELRIQQACLADGVMILRIDLLSALMKIRRRWLRRKGVEPE